MQFIEQTNNTPQLNLRLKFQIQKRHFWIQTLAFTKAKGSRVIQSLISARTSNLSKHFHHRHFSSCHPQGDKNDFVKGETRRLLGTNSFIKLFEELVQIFKPRLRERGYSKNLVQRTVSEAQFKSRKLALLQKPQESKLILLFVTQYHPEATNLKQILMKNWHLIEGQLLLKEI